MKSPRETMEQSIQHSVAHGQRNRDVRVRVIIRSSVRTAVPMFSCPCLGAAVLTLRALPVGPARRRS
jgi:hypothetical protein